MPTFNARAAYFSGCRAYQLGKARPTESHARAGWDLCSKLHSERGEMPSVHFPGLGVVRYIDAKPRTSMRHSFTREREGTRRKYDRELGLKAMIRRSRRRRKKLAARALARAVKQAEA